MADIKEHLDSNEEYQLREESGGDYIETQTPLSDTRRKFPLKRILVPVGLIVGIYVVYQGLSWYSNRQATAPAFEATKHVVVAKKTSAVVAPQPVKEAILPTPVVPSATESAMQQKLETLTQEAENSREQLANLNDTLVKNQQAVNELKDTIDSFSAVLSNIEQQLQKAAVHHKAKKRRYAALPPKPIYHIKAIVPGRAWLENGSGRTITVRVGNKISGYGTVTYISARDGIVIMSSGDVIQYGINDY
jgi:intracellular multiplication protein IcmG